MTTKEPVVECVPNFSEGRDAKRVEAIVAAMRMAGVHLLDWSMDADHNRSVVTIAGQPAAVVESAVRGAGKAAELIDLTRQEGVHPRIGAADVIPFVPISGIKLEQCVSVTASPSTFMRLQRHDPTAPILTMCGAASSKDCAISCARRRFAGPIWAGLACTLQQAPARWGLEDSLSTTTSTSIRPT